MKKKKNCFGSKNPEFIGYRKAIKTRKFFHAATTQRRRGNRIEWLKTSDGRLCEKEENVQEEIESYLGTSLLSQILPVLKRS